MAERERRLHFTEDDLDLPRFGDPAAVNRPTDLVCHARIGAGQDCHRQVVVMEQPSTLPTAQEIVPLLSGVLARRSILPFGRFSLPGGLYDQQIVRQHPESHLDRHMFQAATTGPSQSLACPPPNWT
jgi:hypothetical protein